jgi:AcrR family transcriptional regulator
MFKMKRKPMTELSEKIPTKERIMEVAQRLFAEKGLDGTSMRDITDTAGVNVASVNYHFGSKDGLISAVFDRHLTPVNDARLSMLDTVEKASPNNPPELEAVLEAFIRPAVERAFKSPRTRNSFLLLMGRCMSEPPTYAEKHIYPHFKIVIERFITAVGKAMPELQYEEVFCKMGLVAGALHYALHMQSTNRLPHQPIEKMDSEKLVRHLVAFSAAGLRSRAADLN